MAKRRAQKTYQQMTEELAGYIDWFESADMNLDDAVIKYEEAMQLLQQMEDYLKTAQNKIKNLSVKFE